MQRISVFIIVLAMASCKSLKEVEAGKPNPGLSANRVIKLHQERDFQFNTLASRVHVQLEEGKRTQGLTVGLRMEKDKAIWIKGAVFGIATLAHVMIEPDRVRYYNNIDKEYFDGDFTLLSRWLGVEVDFHTVQSLLLGESAFALDNNRYEVSVTEDSYKLEPKQQHPLLAYQLLINASNFKAASQQLVQPTDERTLDAYYTEWQRVAGQDFPKKIELMVTEANEVKKITLDYKKTDVDVRISFPFSIPYGHEEIILE